MSALHSSRRGFTLIELLVVLSIIGLLVALVTPRYFASLERSKEFALKTSLSVMRSALDQHAHDLGRYPETLEALIQARYLRQIPTDPITGRSDTWRLLPPPADSVVKGAVADVRSGAPGRAQDGRFFEDW